MGKSKPADGAGPEIAGKTFSVYGAFGYWPGYHGKKTPEDLIREHGIDFVFFAYSDVPHADIMHKASLVQAAGASFVMAGPDHTQLPSTKPVISIPATRTGAGKSPLTHWLQRSN